MSQVNATPERGSFELNGFAWGVETISPITPANYWDDFGKLYPSRSFEGNEIPDNFFDFLKCGQSHLRVDEIDVRAVVKFIGSKTYYFSVSGYVTDGEYVFGYRDSSVFYSIVKHLTALYRPGSIEDAPDVSLVSDCR